MKTVQKVRETKFPKSLHSKYKIVCIIGTIYYKITSLTSSRAIRLQLKKQMINPKKSYSIDSVFREIRTDSENNYVTTCFRTFRNGVEISVLVKALTASQFKKMVRKIKHDISIMSIPRVNGKRVSVKKRIPLY